MDYFAGFAKTEKALNLLYDRVKDLTPEEKYALIQKYVTTVATDDDFHKRRDCTPSEVHACKRIMDTKFEWIQLTSTAAGVFRAVTLNVPDEELHPKNAKSKEKSPKTPTTLADFLDEVHSAVDEVEKK